MTFRVTLVALALSLCAVGSAWSQEGDGVAALLARVERAAQSGDAGAFFALLTSGANRARAADFAGTELVPGALRAVLKERDREPLRGTRAGDGYTLILDVLVEFGARARASTWRIDVKRVGDVGADLEWAIDDVDRLSSVENLYRLALNATKAFTAQNLKIAAEDLDLTLAEGSVYVADIDLGVTGL